MYPLYGYNRNFSCRIGYCNNMLFPCWLKRCFSNRIYPKWVRRILSQLIYALIAWLYVSFLINVIPDLKNEFGLGRRFRISFACGAFQVCFVLLCWSLYTCATCTKSYLQGRATNENNNARFETKYAGGIRECKKCNNPKPDRTHHCSSCNSCILKMDHHCVFINTCVGYYNYKPFMLFLFWSSATCLLQSLIIYHSCLGRHAYIFVSSVEFGSSISIILEKSGQVVVICFISFCLGVALLVFFMVHLCFAAKNITTLEYCEKKRSSDNFVNIFDVGISSNLQQVFGRWTEFYFWLLPILPVTDCNGINFPTNAYANEQFCKDQ